MLKNLLVAIVLATFATTSGTQGAESSDWRAAGIKVFNSNIKIAEKEKVQLCNSQLNADVKTACEKAHDYLIAQAKALVSVLELRLAMDSLGMDYNALKRQFDATYSNDAYNIEREWWHTRAGNVHEMFKKPVEPAKITGQKQSMK